LSKLAPFKGACNVGLPDSASVDAIHHIVGTTRFQGSRCALNTRSCQAYAIV
jgi:hypothetical protein